MVHCCSVYVAITLALVHIVLCKIGNDTADYKNKLDAGGFGKAADFNLDNRRKRNRDDSSGKKKDKDSESLEVSDSSSSSGRDRKRKEIKKNRPFESSEERRGWRKYHRKCTPCPEEMEMKWRDPSIKWICGAYQRARRSFKSSCMMYYRNCQDGTMFTKIADHRCENDTVHGEHFFYDYPAPLSGDTSRTDLSETTEEESRIDSSDSSGSSS